MRIIFAVFVLFIAYVASYPSFREGALDDDENDSALDLELRSILNHLSRNRNDNEQMTRSFSSDLSEDEDDDEDEFAFSKRQGGHNIVDKQSKCEIQCIYQQRNPTTGKGKSVKEAAKICRKQCPNPNKRRSGTKDNIKQNTKGKEKSLRQLLEDDSNEEQTERRELYDYLMEQIQRNHDE